MKCICNPKRCTGCGACFNACKTKNIVIETNESGFKYPVIKNDKTCSSCNFICPENTNDYFQNSKISKVFAVQLKDKSRLLKSTSGGMFYALSKYVFDRGGVVYGAIYNEKMEVFHTCAKNEAELEKMHGSKYIYSNIDNIYCDIKHFLENGTYVLFTGLPCQISGLKSFLLRDYENLITMDLICSGVPSQKLFSEYIRFIERKYLIKILDFKFRDKRKYGCSHTVVIKYKNIFGKVCEKTFKERKDISYYNAFGKENCFRDSCYDCKYNQTIRISDFTVGGFWGISKTKSKLNEYEGISLVLANTEKSLDIIESVKNIAFVEQYSMEDAVRDNRALYEKTPKDKYEREIWSVLRDKGYKKAAIKFFNYSSPIKRIIKKLIPTYIKTLIKRIIK